MFGFSLVEVRFLVFTSPDTCVLGKKAKDAVVAGVICATLAANRRVGH